MSTLKDKITEWFESQPDEIDPVSLLADLARCTAAVAVKIGYPIESLHETLADCVEYEEAARELKKRGNN